MTLLSAYSADGCQFADTLVLTCRHSRACCLPDTPGQPLHSDRVSRLESISLAAVRNCTPSFYLSNENYCQGALLSWMLVCCKLTLSAGWLLLLDYMNMRLRLMSRVLGLQWTGQPFQWNLVTIGAWSISAEKLQSHCASPGCE